MSNFYSVVKQDTPRLVVMFKRPTPEQESFQWGMVGSLPLLGLIGYITRIQQEIPCVCSDEDENFCPESALVIVWDKGNQLFDWYYNPDIPTDSLVGMLEVIKSAFVTSQLAQSVRNQQVGICGPDGKPMRM